MRLHYVFLAGIACAWLACGGEEAPAPKAAGTAPAAAKSSAPPAEAAPAKDLDTGIVLALAQFVTEGGKPIPGPARLEFLQRRGGEWQVSALEDPDSVVFHKAMVFQGPSGQGLLTLAGSAPGTGDPGHLKFWTVGEDGLSAEILWAEHWEGKVSRMRDGEVADLYGDGRDSIAVATHDQGVVAVLRPGEAGFEVTELDRKPDTFVHEIEVGDLDGDGTLEVYATPSEPNRLDGGAAQRGEVVRYVPATGEGRVVVADLGDRHAKEILVEDLDGDGRDELYVAVEGHMGADKRLEDLVEIRRYDADTPADAGRVVATLRDRLTRFLTAGDVDGDGRKEVVAAAFSSGLWLLRPGSDPDAKWKATLIDRNSAGFEHAALLTDLDGDGVDELYVASDKHKEVRRYTWQRGKPIREVIYERPDARPIFTWNLMPVPVSLIP